MLTRPHTCFFIQKNTMNDKAYAFAMGAVFFAAIATVLLWAGERDKQVNAWATAYEACVEREYGMTPATYYQQTNTYPTCEK